LKNRVLVKWKHQSCFFDGFLEYLYGVAVRKPFLFRGIRWTKGGAIDNFLQVFKARTGDQIIDTHIKDRFLQEYVSKRFEVKYGEANDPEWMDSLLYDEDKKETEQFAFRSLIKCSNCRRSEKIIHYILSETELKNLIQDDSCQSCGLPIWPRPPHLLFLCVTSMLFSERTRLPEFIVLLGSRYRLSFVTESALETGFHFYNKMLWKNDYPIHYDSLNNATQGVCYTEGCLWPTHFHFPNIVIYEKGKCLEYSMI
jgi:hypothetical protein